MKVRDIFLQGPNTVWVDFDCFIYFRHGWPHTYFYLVKQVFYIKEPKRPTLLSEERVTDRYEPQGGLIEHLHRIQHFESFQKGL